MIVVENLSKTYKTSSFVKKISKDVLKNINFSVKSGEILAILGESGCGKSTLARLICNLEKPSGGRIYLKNRDIKEIDKKEFSRQVQIVFQDAISSVNPVLSVFEAVSEPLFYLSNFSKKEQEDRVVNLLKIVNLDPVILHKKTATLSGGMLQRLSIARALAIEPEVIILDEATSSVDLILQEKILEIICSLKGKMSFILIAHDIRLAKLISDRIIVLDNGEISETIENGAKFEFKSEIGKRLENAILPPKPLNLMDGTRHKN